LAPSQLSSTVFQMWHMFHLPPRSSWTTLPRRETVVTRDASSRVLPSKEFWCFMCKHKIYMFFVKKRHYWFGNFAEAHKWHQVSLWPPASFSSAQFCWRETRGFCTSGIDSTLACLLLSLPIFCNWRVKNWPNSWLRNDYFGFFQCYFVHAFHVVIVKMYWQTLIFRFTIKYRYKLTICFKRNKQLHWANCEKN